MTRVTIFITTIGASTFPACLKAAKAQDIPVVVDVIDRVAPWAAAQNEMVRRCQTDLFVQLDEDMILYRNGVRRLVDLIDRAVENVVMACAPVFDVDLDMPIMGTKIYRHALVKTIPFEAHVLGDTHDRQRWAEAGLTFASAPRDRKQCVADHGTSYTPEEIFERWRRMWQRHRRTGKSPWIEKWIPRLRERLEHKPTSNNYYALLGAIIGATEEPWPDGDGPDFTRPNPTLERLKKILP